MTKEHPKKQHSQTPKTLLSPYRDLFHISSNTGLTLPIQAKTQKERFDVKSLTHNNPQKLFLYEQYLLAREKNPSKCCIAPFEFIPKLNNAMVFSVPASLLKKLEPHWLTTLQGSPLPTFNFQSAFNFLKQRDDTPDEIAHALGFHKTNAPIYISLLNKICLYVLWHKAFYGEIPAFSNPYGSWQDRPYPLAVSHTHPEKWQDIVHSFHDICTKEQIPSKKRCTELLKAQFPNFPSVWIRIAVNNFDSDEDELVFPSIAVRPLDYSYHLLLLGHHPYYQLKERENPLKNNTPHPYPNRYLLSHALGHTTPTLHSRVTGAELFDLYTDRHPKWELIERHDIK